MVLKVLSPDIAHKSEAGGVVLGLQSADEVGTAYDAMMARVREREPNARIEGALVARMIAGGVETVIGIKRDPVFGPVVMFGLGGVYVEVLKDVTLRLAPVDHATAQEMIRRIKGFALLAGARGKPPVDLDALADAIVAMSRFGAAHEVASAEINPFIALPRGRRRGRRADPDRGSKAVMIDREQLKAEIIARRGYWHPFHEGLLGAVPGIPAAYLRSRTARRAKAISSRRCASSSTSRSTARCRISTSAACAATSRTRCGSAPPRKRCCR